MKKKVFLDTCVLYSETLCDLLLRMAEKDIIIPFWSSEILCELSSSVMRNTEGINIDRRIKNMRDAFPSAEIFDYENYMDKVHSSEEDKHVMAAALASPCDTLVTFNTKDFPTDCAPDNDIQVCDTDIFLLQLLEEEPQRISTLVIKAMLDYATYPKTPKEYKRSLTNAGVTKFAHELYGELCR